MALEFDGTNQYVNVPNSSSLNITEGSWMVWFKVPSAESFKSLLVKRTIDVDHNSWGYWTALRPTGYYEVGVSNNTPSYGYYKYGSVALDDNVIHHIVAIFSDSTDLKCYVDGMEVSGTYSGTKPTIIGYQGEPLQFGRNGESIKTTSWDARVYNRVLSANEIAEIYHRQGADKVWQGLVGWWRMDEKTSTQTASGAGSIIDLSGNGNHGTPYNSPVYQESPHRLRRGVIIS